MASLIRPCRSRWSTPRRSRDSWVLRIAHNVSISALRKRRDDVIAPDELPERPVHTSVEESALLQADRDEIWEAPMLAQVAGIATDSKDHIWVFHRPRTATEDERGATLSPPRSKCCVPAPPVIEFDREGNLLNAAGEEVNAVNYADSGEWAVRARQSADAFGLRGWDWLAPHDGGERRGERRIRAPLEVELARRRGLQHGHDRVLAGRADGAGSPAAGRNSHAFA